MRINPLHFMLLMAFFTYSQEHSTNNSFNQSQPLGNNGYIFEVEDAGANSQYSEFVSGFFKNKVITTSSKKQGVVSKIDSNTNEGYKDLYCLNHDEDGYLSSPLLFSRILNTGNSEDQLTFSPNQNTVYYTRSSNKNTLEYKLYKADLEKDSHGNWINEELLDINKENISIENPYVSPEGDKLYFSSNMPNTFGGYDIYVSNINNDGSLSEPKNLGSTINTKEDEKHPSLSNDSKYLYFASKGHENLGGFDLFSSKIVNKNYSTPRNLGNTVNTSDDEVAFYIKENNKGYISSNRPDGSGGFDIYLVNFEVINQNLKGRILDSQNKSPLINTLLILKDEEGNEISRQTTNSDGTYDFDVIPFEAYTITTLKEGFKDRTFEFASNRGNETLFYRDLEIENNDPPVEKLTIENIYFDFNKDKIRNESNITLSSLIKILNENPEIELIINAHTDNKGSNSYNKRLSKRRAKATLKFLEKNGVNNKIETKSFGEEAPFIDCKKTCTEEEDQSNRRVEFILINSNIEKKLISSNSINQNYNYYIIAGSFRKEKNYLRKIAQLKTEGYPNAKRIGFSENGLHQVAYEIYYNEIDATEALKNIKQTNNEKAWMKVEKQ